MRLGELGELEVPGEETVLLVDTAQLGLLLPLSGAGGPTSSSAEPLLLADLGQGGLSRQFSTSSELTAAHRAWQAAVFRWDCSNLSSGAGLASTWIRLMIIRVTGTLIRDILAWLHFSE